MIARTPRTRAQARIRERQHEPVSRVRNGVLLANLGTPDAPTAPAIREFLRKFLSDRRVVPLSPFLWLPVLYGIILPLRPRKLVPAYSSIWTDDGSPLNVYTNSIAAGLRRGLSDTQVAIGMSYGWPSIEMAVKELELHQPERLLVLPMYPQYSRTTTASVFDAVNSAMAGRRWSPEFRVVNDYHRDSAYIAALAESVTAHWASHGRGEKLLMSFHGIPQKGVDEGDPYLKQCQTTAERLAASLELPESQWQICFQSRVGPAQWTQPYTEEVLRETAASCRTIDVICPGFAADCLETLEEIAIRGAESFKAAGGESLRYIPALNDSQSHIELFARIAGERLQD